MLSEDKDAEVTVKRLMFSAGEKQVMPVREYTLKEAGKGVYENKVTKNIFLSSKSFRFCYVNYEVKEIVGFSGPADFLGERVSKVEFTYAVASIADWAYKLMKSKGGGLKTLNKQLEPVNEKKHLVLMSNGSAYKKGI